MNHFMKSTTFETELSDHHKLATTVLIKTIRGSYSNKKLWRDYKNILAKKQKIESELKLKPGSK